MNKINRKSLLAKKDMRRKILLIALKQSEEREGWEEGGHGKTDNTAKRRESEKEKEKEGGDDYDDDAVT